MAPTSRQGLLFIGGQVLRGNYLSQTLRDGWPSPRQPFGVVTAVEQRLTFVAPAQMKPGLKSKAPIVRMDFRSRRRRFDGGL